MQLQPFWKYTKKINNLLKANNEGCLTSENGEDTRTILF